MALAVPAAFAGVAALWSGGVIDPDPNGALIQALQGLGLPSLVLSPIGFVLALWGANVRGAGRWAAFLLWGVPLGSGGRIFSTTTSCSQPSPKSYR